MKRLHRVLVSGAVLCLAVALLLSYSTIAQGEVIVSVNAPAEVAEGTNFIAGADIIEVVNLDAGNFDVSYDPDVLEVTNVTDGMIGGTTIPIDMWAVIDPGIIRVIQNVPGVSGVSGSGYLAEIHFHVVGGYGNNSEIILFNGILSDNSAHEIPATWVGNSMHVNTALDAEFSVNPLEGIAGVTEFTYTDAISGGTPPYIYQWDFDNDEVVDSTASGPTHIYASAGTYTVSLTGYDSLDTSIIETKVNYVTVYAPLDAEFIVSPLEGVAGFTGFTFTDVITGGKIPYTYEWDLNNDGVIDSTAASPTHIYTSVGTYAVSLIVTDSLTNISTMLKVDYITIYKPGDANKDGNVNSIDITKVERIIITLDAPTPGADANGDGNVNAMDITAVELIIMGG